MFCIVKYIKNSLGIEMPVVIIDSHSEVLEFDTEKEAENMRIIFAANSDSGYRYIVKKI